MANKIKNLCNEYIEMFNNGYVSVDCLKKKWDELSDIIYRLYQNDLISEKVKDECYKALNDFSTFILFKAMKPGKEIK